MTREADQRILNTRYWFTLYSVRVCRGAQIRYILDITFYRNCDHVLADQPCRFKTKSSNMTPSSGRKVWRFIVLSC